MDNNPISVPNLCEWCGGVGTCRCGRCHVVYYCSREHQMQHWAIHKKICKKSSPPVLQSPNLSLNMPSLPPVMSSNLSHDMPSSSNISHNISSSSNISNNRPSSNVLMNSILPSHSLSNNMPACNISHSVSLSSNSQDGPSSSINQNINIPSTSNLTFLPTTNWNQSDMLTHINEDIHNFPLCSNTFNQSNSSFPPEISLDYNIACADEILSKFGQDLLSSDNSFWNLIDTCDAQNVSDLDLYLGKDGMNQMSVLQNISSATNISNSPYLTNDEDVNLIECAPLNDICKNVIHDLNMYGICVLDRFIGSKRGNLVLNEVKDLYSTGIFEKGKLVKTSTYIASESIRSDVTTWVDGTEPYCPNIGYLMQKLDLVIATCNKMPNNGQLSKYKLHRRTKAMVACYPGNGTYYKKHVDNPNRDGRCITCIYYLNENWDVEKHGGMLRMFPSARDSDVAQIAPIFDRMLFFWSDKRNPHEVLPALAMRFAITVWYFDADERDAALKVLQEKSQHPQNTSFS